MNEDFDVVDNTPSRTKEFTYNDVIYVLTANDPYGMWTISSKRGSSVSASLQGQFTSFSEAEKAIVKYHSEAGVRIEQYQNSTKKESKALVAAKRHQEYLALKEEMDNVSKAHKE